MTGMIERVANAIAAVGVPGEADLEDYARAAINAMREPTEAMKDAYYTFDERFSPYPASDCWGRMIDAALAEKVDS